VSAQDDPAVVRREYETDEGLVGRQSIWAGRTGRQPFDVAFAAVLAAQPRRVLEVGCGRGEFAERLGAAGIAVVAVDQSAHMVELTRARGVEARIADVEVLPFADDEFDLVVANFMLYHVADVDGALSELARVACRLVAATNGVRQLVEMWELVGRDLAERRQLFFCETGEEFLRRHYLDVEHLDASGTIDLTADDMRHYIAHSIAHKHLADRVPAFGGVRAVTAASCVFVAARP
jgi:SAM-dependent methyltransferase